MKFELKNDVAFKQWEELNVKHHLQVSVEKDIERQTLGKHTERDLKIYGNIFDQLTVITGKKRKKQEYRNVYPGISQATFRDNY